MIGLEPTLDAYLARLVEVFGEVRRVLRPDGTLWLNMGNCYNAYNGGAGPSSSLSQTASAQRPDLPTGYGLRDRTFKPKDLIGLAWLLALALQRDGWWLRSDLIWAKPAPMPGSQRDRPTTAHEYVFLLSRSANYFYDGEAIAEPLDRPDEGMRGTPARFGGALKFQGIREQSRLHSGNAYVGTPTGKRTARTVWTIPSEPFTLRLCRACRHVTDGPAAKCPICGAVDWNSHYATFPTDLAKRCILAGTKPGDLVLDPFMGTGRTGLAAQQLGRRWVGCDLNPDSADLAKAQCGDLTLAMPL